MKAKLIFTLLILPFFIACNKEKPPKVETRDITEITENSAKSGGNVTSIGDGILTSRGICWNTTGNPTTADNFSFDGADVGDYASFLTNLSPNTKYFVKAYAKNNFGAAYGKEKSFTTTQETDNSLAIIGIYYGQDTVTYTSPPSNPIFGPKTTVISKGGTKKDTIYISPLGPQNTSILAFWTGSYWMIPNQGDQNTYFSNFSLSAANNKVYLKGNMTNGPSNLDYSFGGNK